MSYSNNSSERSSLLRGGSDLQYDTLPTETETESIDSYSESPKRFWKNLLALSISFLFTFTAFSSIQNLESTLNHSAGLGVASLSCIYGGLVLACFFAPAYVALVGPKWSIVTGMCSQVLFTAVNFYPTFYTLIPASVILGVASAPLWTGQGVYITQLANDYAETIVDEASTHISRFNGVFFLFFTSSQIIGNLISSLVLFEGANTPSSNHSIISNTSQCGAKFCSLDSLNGSSSGSSIAPPQHLVYILMGVYTACSCMGLLIFSTLADNRPQPQSSQTKTPKQYAMSTLSVHGNILLLMLIPLFVWTGMEQSFMFGEFTQAFISCELGIGQVGFAMTAFGVVDAISSFIVGNLQKLTGRGFIILMGFTVNIALLVTMLTWDPNKGDNKHNILYVIPALWGVGDAIWNAVVSALVGIVFDDNQEPAFAAFRMWQSLGFVIIFATSHFLCMAVKTYMAIATCGVAMVMYVAMEIVLRRQAAPAWMDLTNPIST